MRSERAILWLAAVLLFAAGSAHAILPIQHWQTTSGARVYFVENRDLPMLDVSVEFPAGAGFDSKEKSGAASMTNRLLRLGAEGMNEDEIAQRLADVGAQLSGSFDTDRAGLALRTLSSREERTQALDIFARLLQRPVFPEDVLEREKVRLIAALREADTKPDTIAALTFYRLLYRDHPYALRSSGEVETVRRLTRQDLVDFYRRHYTAQQAVVALIGDVSRSEAAALAEQLTSGLPRDDGAELALPPVTPLPAAATRFIVHPAAQSHIMIGAPGIRRDDPDYFPLFVGNYILGGGGFVSRITEEVRQKRGLAYSAYSYFSPLKQQGPFLIGMQTQREQAQEALTVVRNTLREFLAEGPTQQELTAAKQNLVGGFPLRIDSNRRIHGYLALIGFYRLPLTYLDDFVKKVEQVSLADIKTAFARRLDLDRMVTVVVGATEAQAAASQAPN
ncbi:MAG: zinc protease [Betaproteobacteria bacterium RIFCSPLOWO2_12_FULL_62_13]|nr:MAG: zinc protease [Betaproteobacteria bacterium RIFCSPLOWO2_12_FULL_62_13]